MSDRVTVVSDRAPVRVWAAIEPVPGVVVADVRDVVDVAGRTVRRGTAAYRPHQWQEVDAQGRANCKGTKAKDCGCRPGQPCAAAHVAAARWWPEWQRRLDARHWVANRPNVAPTIFAADNWGKRRGTLAEAEADALALGLPRVLLLNGHGETLEERPVGARVSA